MKSNSNETDDTLEDVNDVGESFERMIVTGREDTFLKLLAGKMNFKYEYVDPPEREQGIQIGISGNLTFTGELGMLQRRVRHFYQ